MAKTKIRIELDRTHVLAVGVSFAAPLVADTTRETLNRARIKANVRTGNMRAGLRMTMRAARTYVRGTVESPAKYSIYVHDGSAPHLIKARRGGFLRFSVPPGVVMYRKMVRHPGYAGNPFLRQPLAQVAGAKGFTVTGYSGASGKIGFGMASE